MEYHMQLLPMSVGQLFVCSTLEQTLLVVLPSMEVQPGASLVRTHENINEI